jgi:DNA-binding NarL/FixJ family response regulator
MRKGNILKRQLKPRRSGPWKVFLVDDHPVFTEVLSEFLNRSEDFDVVGTAADGKTALAALGELEIDILLLDLMLPGVSGLEILATVRSRRLDIRTVVFSGLGSDAVITEAYLHGVCAFIEKSERLDQLLSTLRLVANGTPPLSERVSSLLRDVVRKRSYQKVANPGDLSILKQFALGYTVKETAYNLNLTIWAVYKSKARITSRMGIKNFSNVFLVAQKLGLLQPGTVAPKSSEALAP